MKKAVIAVALLALLSVVSAAQAKSVAYSGKTAGGYRITFKKSGNKISRVRTGVPTVCLPTTSSFYPSNSGVDLFNPPGSFRIGATTKRQKLQKTAMWHAKVTKYYTVKLRKAGRKVKGSLQTTFSYGLPVLDTYYGARLIIYVCRSNTKFSAKPR
jgi:hypothetical protein